MNKTTLVIPNYNGLAYIENCLKSVFSSDTPADVIVVDNGSTDYSCELVEEKFPSVTLVKLGANTGFCHATNEGIKLAKTEYVMFLNDDTEIDPKAIGYLEKFLDSHKGAFSVQAKMVNLSNPDLIDSAGDLYCALGWAFAIGKDKKASGYTGCRRIFSCCGGASLYRKAYLDEIGYLDENHFAYLEDVDLGYRAQLNGYKNYVCYDAVVKHAGSGFSGSRHNEFKVKLSAQNSIYVIYKNEPILQILINLPFIILGILVKFIYFMKKGLSKAFLKGIAAGFKLCGSESGKSYRTKFTFNRLYLYICLQIMLWVNMVRRICG